RLADARARRLREPPVEELRDELLFALLHLAQRRRSQVALGGREGPWIPRGELVEARRAGRLEAGGVGELVDQDRRESLLPGQVVTQERHTAERFRSEAGSE